MPSSTVFVVDDDPTIRNSVAALIQARGVAAQPFASAEEFLAAYNGAAAGCLVLDMRIPGMSGMELLRQLQSRGSTLPVIVITGYGDVPTAVEAMKAGAIEFLEKPCSEQDLWTAIENAISYDRAQQASRRHQAEIKQRIESLTEDELRVYRLLFAGHPNKEISLALKLGLRTVELRRANLLKKMHASSLSELVRMAIVGGLSEEKSST